MVSGKGEGRLHSDRKGVVPLHPAVLCQPDQGEDRSVALCVFPHKRGIQGHLIDGAVRDQRAAGAVQYVAPGRLHRLRLRNAGLGLFVIVVAVDLLDVIQGAPQNQQDHSHHTAENAYPAVKLSSI